MKENEYKGLIDRAGALAEFEKHFVPLREMFQDMVNYGSNLIPRCFASSDKSMTPRITIGVFLKQVVAMLDGFEVQLSRGALYSSHLQARAIMEASITSEWLLSSESERKATFYYVSDLRHDRMWALRTVEGSREREYYLSATQGYDLKDRLDSDEAKVQGKARLAVVEEALAMPEYAAVNKAFEVLCKPPNFLEPFWYRAYGCRSIRAIAKDVGRLHEYEAFYSLFSEVVHVSRIRRHLKYEKDVMWFEPIRLFENLDVLCNVVATMAIRTYKKYLDVYRGGEDAFTRKYLEEWRPIYLAILKVKYTNANVDS